MWLSGWVRETALAVLMLISETEGNMGKRYIKGLTTGKVSFADLLSYLHGLNKHE